MKANAKVLIELEKVWGNPESNSVNVVAVRYSSATPLVSSVRVVRTIVTVDGQTEIDTLNVSNTWPDQRLVIELVHEYERLVENHPCSHELPVQHEPAKQDDVPF